VLMACVHLFMIGEHSSPYDIEPETPGVRKISSTVL
jgi:hypothetical protein